MAATRPSPAGETGLLAIHRSDPGLMLGYWRRPDEDAAVFRGDWFVAGDLVVVRCRRLRLVPRPRRRRDECRRLPRLAARGRGGARRPSGGGRGRPSPSTRCATACGSSRPGSSFARRRRRRGAGARRSWPQAATTLAAYKRPREMFFVDALPRTAERQGRAPPAPDPRRGPGARPARGRLTAYPALWPVPCTAFKKTIFILPDPRHYGLVGHEGSASGWGWRFAAPTRNSAGPITGASCSRRSACTAPIARADIARRVGLTTQTVSNIIRELEVQGFIVAAPRRAEGPRLSGDDAHDQSRRRLRHRHPRHAARHRGGADQPRRRQSSAAARRDLPRIDPDAAFREIAAIGRRARARSGRPGACSASAWRCRARSTSNR